MQRVRGRLGPGHGATARDVDEDQAAPGLAARHAEGARHAGRRGAAARGGEQEARGARRTTRPWHRA